eukprot:g7514.t1
MAAWLPVLEYVRIVDANADAALVLVLRPTVTLMLLLMLILRGAMARYSLMHYKHPNCAVGRETKARQAGTGWEDMIVWYNADGSAEPMSEWDDETTSGGVQR